MDRLEYYMKGYFDPIELREFLGKDIADLLVEWISDDEQLYSEDNLTMMIKSVYGDRILDNPDFRARLFSTFDEKLLLEYARFFPKTKTADIKGIVQQMAKAKWGENDFSFKVLDDLGIDRSYFSKEKDERNSIEKVTSFDTFYELLDYQFLIRQKILTYMNSDNDETRMLVRMPTGTGKTKTAMHTIINQYVFNQKKKGIVIWVAHTKELLDQAYDTFCNVWQHVGLGETQTYKLWGDFDITEEQIEDGFVFVGIQKLMSIERNDIELFQRLTRDSRIIVIDEAHRAGAPNTKETISNLMANYGKKKSLIGLTATPGRAGESDLEIFKSMFDKKIIDIDIDILNKLNLSKVDADNIELEADIIKYFQNRGVLAKLSRTPLEYGGLSDLEISSVKMQMKKNGYEDFSEEFLRAIALNKKRNKAIIDKLIELNNQHIPTIVFSCSVEHGRMLSAALTMQGIKNGQVFGTMDSVERKKVITDFKNRDNDLNILINYEVLTTGFDATNIGCVFITRPTNSVVLYSQMLGRGLRGPQMGGNESCELVDVVDNLEKYTNESQAFNYFANYWK